MKPLTPSTPHLIVLMGIPGSGKTQFAEHFSKMFQAPFVNARQLQAVAATDDEHGEALALTVIEQLLRTQRTFLYEGPTYDYGHRVELAKRIKAAGFKPLLIWVQTESLASKKRAMASREYSPEDFAALVERFQPPLASEKPVVISGKHTFATQVKMVLRHLADNTRTVAPRPQQPPQPPVGGSPSAPSTPQTPNRPPRSGRIIAIR